MTRNLNVGFIFCRKQSIEGEHSPSIKKHCVLTGVRRQRGEGLSVITVWVVVSVAAHHVVAIDRGRCRGKVCAGRDVHVVLLVSGRRLFLLLVMLATVFLRLLFVIGDRWQVRERTAAAARYDHRQGNSGSGCGGLQICTEKKLEKYRLRISFTHDESLV